MAGRPWAKVWPEKWLASQRTRSLDYEAQGLYWAVFMRAAAANDRGELRVGDRPWTVADLALDLGLDRRRLARLEQRLGRLLEVGLLERQPDGCLRVARWDALQAGWKPGGAVEAAQDGGRGQEAQAGRARRGLRQARGRRRR